MANYAEAALWLRKGNRRYDPDGLDHDRLMELMHRVAERAFAEGRVAPAARW